MTGSIQITPSEVWSAVRLITKGKSEAARVEPLKLRKANGNLSVTEAESRAVMTASLAETFSKTGTFNQDTINSVRLRPLQPWLDKVPTSDEISKAIKKAKNNKAAGENGICIELYKALEEDDETKLYFEDMLTCVWKSGSFPTGDIADGPAQPMPNPTIAIARKDGWTISFEQRNPKQQESKSHDRYEQYKSSRTCAEALQNGASLNDLNHDFKHNFLFLHDPTTTPRDEPMQISDDSLGVMYEEWKISRMKLLPKKGDLSLCKNWRAICLLDVASKVLSSIVAARTQSVQLTQGMEEQAGFRPDRSTIDALFSVGIGLNKRKEHGLETWALYIDLVKAFDSVPREALFMILRRFGFPDHFVNIIIRLHSEAKIKVKIGDVDTEMDSSIGVRQGSCEGPVLFLFFMQAVMETLVWPAGIIKPEFCTSRAGGAASGAGAHSQRSQRFDFCYSLFADDCALLFDTREDLQAGAECMYKHLRLFGMEMHIGRDGAPSKSEAMFYPTEAQNYDDADTSSFSVNNGHVSFAVEFKYLGATISNSLTSDADVDKRLKQASAVFGALKATLTRRDIDLKVRGRIYVTLCLSILLYGSECWSLRLDLKARLTRFHASCARTMCRIKMSHTMRHHIRSADLFTRLGIYSFDCYYYSRLLRWAGHVARMPLSRLPRMLITSWVDHPRPTGSPPMSWARNLQSVLTKMNLPRAFAFWSMYAQNRESWHERTCLEAVETQLLQPER